MIDKKGGYGGHTRFFRTDPKVILRIMYEERAVGMRSTARGKGLYEEK